MQSWPYDVVTPGERIGDTNYLISYLINHIICGPVTIWDDLQRLFAITPDLIQQYVYYFVLL